MPLVPEASHGLRGVLIHTSTPCTSCWVREHVVVTQKDDVILDVRPANEVAPALDQLFSGFVLWMRLAGQDQLHGALPIGQDADEPVGIAQQQIRPLVGREAAGKAES